jgi:diketogulonate reductase-like aldo/keto reductase
MLLPECKVRPHVNQIECHTRCAQQELVTFCQAKEIQCVAYSPIAGSDLEAQLLVSTGARHSKSAAAVVLRWLLQRGIVVIPCSSKPSRIATNRLEADGWELSADEVEALFALDEPERSAERVWAKIL